MLTIRMKNREAVLTKKLKREERRIAAVQRRAKKLKTDNPDIIADIIFKEPYEGWLGDNLSLPMLRQFPDWRQGYNRFTRAMAELDFQIGSTHIEMLAATVMGFAARSARVKKPTKLEAAVLAVAVGLEPPARTERVHEQRVETWKKRNKLVAPRARRMLLAYPMGMKHASYFEDGKLIPRRGGETDSRDG
jgi:hypothetical protein